MAKTKTAKDAKDWVAWLQGYGPLKFYRAFMRSAQYAEGTCIHCRQEIYLDIAEGGGVPDWGSRIPGITSGLDYGCDKSPDTTSEGVGSHEPRKLRRR